MRSLFLTPCLALLLASLATPAAAQVRSVEIRAPRAFGYFVGDVLRAQIDIVADEGFSVRSASLPRPGPLAYWLDLRSVEVDESRQGDARRIRLNLTYQNFYAALDTRPLEIPGFEVTLASESGGGTTTARAQVPGWSFTISPLREVQPPRQESAADYLRPDGTAPIPDPRPLGLAAAGFLAVAALALVGLARDRAWGPFGRRRARAFAAVLRRVRVLARGPEDDGAYREGLLALHRGLDATDGRRVLADDLGDFLARHPAYDGQSDRLTRFFAASRLAFFGRETAAARQAMPLSELTETARRLAAAERTA